MGKNSVRIWAICFLLFIASCANCGLAVGQSLQDALSAIYNAEIGTKEASGRNDGARIAEYLSGAGVDRQAPWCAAFVAWCYDRIGVSTPRSAWSPSWFPASHTVYVRGGARGTPFVPNQGDVFGIYYPRMGRIAHVGFIDGIDGSCYITVEGNTNENGSRNGDGVYRKRRPIRTISKVSRWI